MNDFNGMNANNTMTPPMQMKVDPKDVLKCSKCDSVLFLTPMAFIRISGLVSPTGQPTLMPQPAGIICAACSTPVQETQLDNFVKSGETSGLILPDMKKTPVQENNSINEQKEKEPLKDNVVSLFSK